MVTDFLQKARQGRMTALETLAFRRKVETNVFPLNHALARSARIRAAMAEQAAMVHASALAQMSMAEPRRMKRATK